MSRTCVHNGNGGALLRRNWVAPVVVGGLALLLVPLNLGGCAKDLLAYSYGPQGLSAADGYQSLNGFFYTPNLSGSAYTRGTGGQVVTSQAPMLGAGTTAAKTEGVYVGDGLYSNGFRGLNYYFSPAYYAGGFY